MSDSNSAPFIAPIVVNVWGIPSCLIDRANPSTPTEVLSVEERSRHNDRLRDFERLIVNTFSESYKLKQDANVRFIVNFPSDRRPYRNVAEIYIEIKIFKLPFNLREDQLQVSRLRDASKDLARELPKNAADFLVKFDAFKRDLAFVTLELTEHFSEGKSTISWGQWSK
ncbi:MAG: hypothetical protein AAB473_04450 [Patescibacteria group bacterium]